MEHLPQRQLYLKLFESIFFGEKKSYLKFGEKLISMTALFAYFTAFKRKKKKKKHSKDTFSSLWHAIINFACSLSKQDRLETGFQTAKQDCILQHG